MMTTNTTHTPGPWEAKIQSATRAPHYIRAASGAIVGSTYFDTDLMDDPCNEVDANARLIAAAPDLMSALEAFCKAVNDRQFGDIKSAVDQKTFDAYCLAKQALAKAKGEL